MHIKELDERAHEKGCDDCSNSGNCDDISRSAAGNQKESNTKGCNLKDPDLRRDDSFFCRDDN